MTALGVGRETVRNWFGEFSNGQQAKAKPDARVRVPTVLDWFDISNVNVHKAKPDGLYEKAAAITGLKLDMLRKCKSLADRFELCSRLHNVSWAHHDEVASIKLTGEKAGGACMTIIVTHDGLVRGIHERADAAGDQEDAGVRPDQSKEHQTPTT